MACTSAAAGLLGRAGWEKLRSLSGLTKTLWLLFSSPRVPFRPSIGAAGLEEITIPLDLEACPSFVEASRTMTMTSAAVAGTNFPSATARYGT